MKSINLLILFAILFLTSCNQENLEPQNTFIGKESDKRLIGKWERTSMSRDINNTITLILEKIFFQEGNIGKWDTYHFKDLQYQDNFTFYTEQDSLFLQFEHSLHPLKYSIKEDTLILISPQPDSLKYLGSEYFTNKFIN